MTGYNCPHCRLAIEMGSHVWWDLSGGCHQTACRECGTIHQIQHPNNAPDLLFAQPAPLYCDIMAEQPDTILILREWVSIRELPTSLAAQREEILLPNRMSMVRFEELTCNYCGRLGALVPYDDSWPSESDPCPGCGRRGIKVVYVWT